MSNILIKINNLHGRVDYDPIYYFLYCRLLHAGIPQLSKVLSKLVSYLFLIIILFRDLRYRIVVVALVYNLFKQDFFLTNRRNKLMVCGYMDENEK